MPLVKDMAISLILLKIKQEKILYGIFFKSFYLFIWLILQEFKILDLLNNITRTPNFSIVTGPLIKPAQAENQVGEIDSSLSLFS